MGAEETGSDVTDVFVVPWWGMGRETGRWGTTSRLWGTRPFSQVPIEGDDYPLCHGVPHFNYI